MAANPLLADAQPSCRYSLICDSQNLTLHTVLSDGVATVS